ncbi:MAG TPA: molybdate ABC transporter substrate-binding protein [Pirellulales bacterium]|jgi:molybdate transport system substrate-binding protein
MDKHKAKPDWNRDWTVGVRLWIDRHGQAVLGQGRVELLDAIDRLHSITAAAKAVGISYRKAWAMIQEVNKAAGEPLVESVTGGLKGGGAQLTERGRFAVTIYQQLDQALHESAAGVLRRIISPGKDTSACIHLAAAISLQEVVGQLLAEFALQQPAVHVRAVYGASNELADHLLAGAPGDLFISAEARQIDRLAKAGRLVAHTKCVVATNGLAVIGPRGTKPLKKITDLRSKRIQRLVVAEPACPLGGYSKSFLESAGVYDDLLPKVLHVDNSRAVLSAVAAGSADAGVAFASDAARSEICQILFQISASQATAQYVAAIVKGGQQSKAAKALLDFICSASGAKCFRRHGLQPAKC